MSRTLADKSLLGATLLSMAECSRDDRRLAQHCNEPEFPVFSPFRSQNRRYQLHSQLVYMSLDCWISNWFGHSKWHPKIERNRYSLFLCAWNELCLKCSPWLDDLCQQTMFYSSECESHLCRQCNLLTADTQVRRSTLPYLSKMNQHILRKQMKLLKLKKP